MRITPQIKSVELSGIVAYGFNDFPGKFKGKVFGHEFTLAAIVGLKSGRSFGDSTIESLPKLEWIESEYWFEEARGQKEWAYVGTNDKGDLYATAPGSPTWGGFAPQTVAVYNKWIDHPAMNVGDDMIDRLCSPSTGRTVRATKAWARRMETCAAFRKIDQSTLKYTEKQDAKFWEAVKTAASDRMEIPVLALDRPGMQVVAASDRSGGGFKSLSTSKSRRRVLTFDLGIVGRSERFTATQILETQDGVITISKFITPGLPDTLLPEIPESMLRYWRHTLEESGSQVNELDSTSTIVNWNESAEALVMYG